MLTFFVLCNAYIRCCYAAEISALVATLDAATLQDLCSPASESCASTTEMKGRKKIANEDSLEHKCKYIEKNSQFE